MKKLKFTSMTVATVIVATSALAAVMSPAASATELTSFSDRLDVKGVGCAIDLQNDVHCWGWNAEGGTGRGTATEAYEQPEKIKNFKATKVVTGFSGTCAISLANELYCWGNYPSSGDTSFSPRKVDGLPAVTDVAMSMQSMCVIDSQAQLLCWGQNTGWAGHVITWPSSPEVISGTSQVKEVFGGLTSICYSTTSSEVYCVGVLGNALGSVFFESPTLIPELSNSVSVAMGTHHICGVKSTGQATCFGSNYWGQLGTGTSDNEVRAVSPEGLPPLAGITSYANMTCGWTTTGALWCWGKSFETSALQVEASPSLELTDGSAAYYALGGSELCTVSYAGLFRCANILGKVEPNFSELNSQIAKIDNATAGMLKIEWFESLAVGGVDSYSVSYSVYGSDDWFPLPSQSVVGRTATLTGLRSATTYALRVTPLREGSNLPSSEFIGYTAGIGTLDVQILDSDGMPLSGGAYEWISVDGKSKSSKSQKASVLGSVVFNNVPGKPLKIKISEAQTQSGFKITGELLARPVNAPIQLRVPQVPQASSYEVNVKMPNGIVVQGAKVESRGLSSTASIQSQEFSGQISFGNRQSAISDAEGNAVLQGSPEQQVEIRAIYDDGELNQTTDWVVAQPGAQANLTLDYMPVISASQSETSATQNSLVTLNVTIGAPDLNTTFWRGSAFKKARIAAAANAGATVEVVPPADSSQTKCKGKTSLKSKASQSGQAKLVVCANASGIYNFKSKGSVSAGGVFIKVKNAKPTPPQGLAVLMNKNGAQLAWQEPRYSGGAPVLSYEVLASAKGQVTRTLTVSGSSNLKSATFSNLDGQQAWTFEVKAVTKNGSSVATSKQVVIEGDIYKTLLKTPKPALKGVAKVGSKLLINLGTWDSGVVHTFAWYRNGTRILGASKSSYSLTKVDAKASITARIVATKPGYRTVEIETLALKVK